MKKAFVKFLYRLIYKINPPKKKFIPIKLKKARRRRTPLIPNSGTYQSEQVIEVLRENGVPLHVGFMERVIPMPVGTEKYPGVRKMRLNVLCCRMCREGLLRRTSPAAHFSCGVCPS